MNRILILVLLSASFLFADQWQVVPNEHIPKVIAGYSKDEIIEIIKPKFELVSKELCNTYDVCYEKNKVLRIAFTISGKDGNIIKYEQIYSNLNNKDAELFFKQNFSTSLFEPRRCSTKKGWNWCSDGDDTLTFGFYSEYSFQKHQDSIRQWRASKLAELEIRLEKLQKEAEERLQYVLDSLSTQHYYDDYRFWKNKRTYITKTLLNRVKKFSYYPKSIELIDVGHPGIDTFYITVRGVGRNGNGIQMTDIWRNYYYYDDSDSDFYYIKTE